MPDIQTLLIFALAALALTATPGPDMLLIAARSATQGRLAGMATYLGVATGSFCHATALALGLSQLFLAVPYAYDTLRYVGAAYLVFLAWQALRAPVSEPTAPIVRRRQSVMVLFRQGFLSNVLNPKVAVFFLALFPQFLDPAAGSVALQVMVLSLILNVIGFFVNGAVVLIAARLGGLGRQAGGFAQLSQYLLATIFAGLAARLVFDGND